MQDNDMREKLEKIISAYEELQAKMSDPAVLADQKTYNHLAKNTRTKVRSPRRRASTSHAAATSTTPKRCSPIPT